MGIPSKRGFGQSTANKGTEKAGERSNEDDVIELSRTKSLSSVADAMPSLPTPPSSDPKTTNKVHIKIESDSDDNGGVSPSVGDGNPDLGWIMEWRTLDLNSAVASQVEFFNKCPTFNNSDPTYIYFFTAIQDTIRQAIDNAEIRAKDAVAKANLKSLQKYFTHFADTSRFLLRSDLERIKVYDYAQCENPAVLAKALVNNDIFLNRTRQMAFFLCLGTEWEVLSKFIRAAKKCMILAKQQGLFDTIISSVQDIQPTKSSLHMEAILSPEILEMDYDFTDVVWSQWIESCISYFECWTADPMRKFPAEDFIRHLSHYRLAMELFLKHKSISDEKQSRLLKVAETYMSQYRDYAAIKLETKYATLKENVSRSGIYLTEARFCDLAEDIEILMNETPQGIPVDVWNAAVPSMLHKAKVSAAKNAVNVLYKEFQINRYPEDEVAYLWLLTWRNIKHVLHYLTSLPDLVAIRQRAEKSPATIEARDLALPFVERNLFKLLSIVRKDNDALYQKEIESVVGDYCAHIDKYVQGKGEGQHRIYEQFARLSSTKRVPYVYLVDLEEALSRQEAQPANGPQIVAHRVVKRLNHIMEGPREFKRWELTTSGTIETYTPTSTWVKEQASLQQAAGFNYDFREKTPSSSGPLQSRAAATGAGGSDDGDGDKKRNYRPGDNEIYSGSEEEVEIISPGGTKRIEKRKKAKKAKTTKAVTAETLTKAKLEQLAVLAKRPDSTSLGTRSDFQMDEEDEAEDDKIMSGHHPVPENSLDHHRRRLKALRVEERSAVPNAQYPLPETAAPQRAAALQIARELADPGMFTEGPRPEDVQNYINPALRLPLTEEDRVAGPQGTFSIADPYELFSRTNSPNDCIQLPIEIANLYTVQNAEPHLIRRALNRLRTTLGSPFFSSPPRYSHPRSAPNIPESNTQRARREREGPQAEAPVLKRQADKNSVRKSPLRDERRRRRSTRRVPSFSPSLPVDNLQNHRQPLGVRRVEEFDAELTARRSGDDASGADPNLPWNGRNQPNTGGAPVEGSHQTSSTNLSAQTSIRNPDQENVDPAKRSDHGHPEPTAFKQRVRSNANDWNSPSPFRQYDNNIYIGSPICSPTTPTPVRGDRSQPPTGPRLPALLSSGVQPATIEGTGENWNASPPGRPTDDGPNSQLALVNRWISREIAFNNRDMRDAYLLHRELIRRQNVNTLNYLFEILRAGAEIEHFNNYIFEREITFGPEAHAQVRRGVPSMVHPPGTPPAQTDQAYPGWWNDPLEGTRYGLKRPAAAWAESPSERAGKEIHISESRSSISGSGSGSDHSTWTPRSPSPMRDENGDIIPWAENDENVDSILDYTARSPIFSNASDRSWTWRPHPRTGLPEREFNIYVDPDNGPSRSPFDLGEPLLVQNPLNQGQLMPNPRFSPEILRLISAAGRGDHGQINVRVPPGWRINVGPRRTLAGRSGAPSPSGHRSASTDARSSGGQEVTIQSPGFVIHEDAPSSGSVRDRSSAPPTLGLIDPPPDDIVETIEKSLSPQDKPSSPKHSGSRNSHQGNRSKARHQGGSSSSSVPHPQHPKSPPPQTQPAPEPSPEPPWYFSWETSTVVRLRSELLRRGIPLRGLKLKQQMIDRLKADDAENGVPQPDAEDERNNGKVSAGNLGPTALKRRREYGFGHGPDGAADRVLKRRRASEGRVGKVI